MSGGILTVAECRSGRLATASLEALGAARQLPAAGGGLSAVIVGAAVSPLAEALGVRGAETVYVIEDDALAHCTTEVHVRAISSVVAELQPEVVLLPDSAYGRDVASRLSARHNAGLATACVGFSLTPEGQPLAERSVFGGRFIERVAWRAAPRLATLKAGVFVVPPADVSRRPRLLRRDVTRQARACVLSVEQSETSGRTRPDIEEAPVVVAAGRGLGTLEGIRLVEELADTLGAAVGASRAVVDLGWMDHQHQVGQTGRSVAPEIYFACGISGAIQHLAGIGSARVIIAINRDPDAPIFGAADYGIVGEVEEILPRLSAALRAMRAERGGKGE
jgi:electron transfer flavoprotein alpha subunit